MKYCPNCGFQMEDNEGRCSNCGYAENETIENKETNNMIFCTNCGARISDQTQVCPYCNMVINNIVVPNAQVKKYNSGVKTAAKIFLIIGCVANAIGFLWISLITLVWTIPMTVHYFNATKNHKRIGTGFKVCTLLFVSLFAGIFKICDND